MDYSKVNTLKLDGTNKIISVLSKHTGIAANVTSFQTALEQLNANQKKLVDYYSLLGKDTLTIENAKDDQRKGLLKTILPVITMMQIFAYDKKKKNLLKRLESLTPEYLQNCSDIELINLSKKVWLTANKYGIYSLAFINKIKSSLKSNRSKAILKLEKEYGLIPDMIKNVEIENIKFIESLLVYDAEMKKKEKIVLKIKKLDKLTDELLLNKIDRFALLAGSENPGFYKEYHKVREKQFRNPEQEAKTKDENTSVKDMQVEKEQADEVLG